MLQRFTNFLRRPLLVGAGVFLLIVSVVGAAIWLFSADARRQVEALTIASGDSMQWSIDQAEIEFLSLQAAALSADPSNAASLNELRRRFNVFYSRVATVRQSVSFDSLAGLPNVEEGMQRLTDFVERTVPVIDGDDAGLGAALPAMVRELHALRPDLRTLALAGLSSFAQRSEAQRESTRDALRDFGLLAFMLCVVLVGFLLALFSLMDAARRKNAALALAQERLQSIVSTSLEGILVIDRSGRIVDYNGACERIFGYSAAEALGRDLAELIIPEHLRAAHRAGMERYRRNGERRLVGAGLVQQEAQDKSGRVFPAELSVSSTRGEHGEIFIAFIRDISDRVRAEQDLVEARDHAVAGEQAKTELLAVMSHEMRTPLNGVLGTLGLLAETELDETQKRYVAAMETSGNMLLQHVNNVLDVSRADAGMMTAVTTQFDLGLLVDSVVDGLRAEAGRRGNSLTLKVVGPALGHVTGDPARLRQVLVNLIGNAIKFTDNGSVAVEVERQNDGDVEFRVIDTGIGISEDDLGRIFDDFVTLDASYGRLVEGTGLGLGIARRLAALMDGRIGVESEPGEGSLFWLRLPLAEADGVDEPASKPGSSAPTSSGAAELSVLVVEDNEINRLVVREALARRGCRVTEAADGRRGVAAAREQRFELIVMDVSMPELDGVGATRMIRDGGGPNAATQIVALTAHAMPEDIRRFREAGMSDVLTKPLSMERLDTLLDAIRRKERPNDGDDARDAGGIVASFGEGQRRALRRRIDDELKDGLAELKVAGAGDKAATLAHRLAGVAAVAGYREAHAALAGVEDVARSGDEGDFAAAVGAAGKALRKAVSGVREAGGDGPKSQKRGLV